MPAPSTAEDVAFHRSPFGRNLPDLMAFMPKKKVEIAAFASREGTSVMKARVSLRRALSKPMRMEFTATSRIAAGAGIRPRVFLTSIIGATVAVMRTLGASASPPG